MAVRKVMLYNKDDVLRSKSRNVEKIDEKVLILLKDMADTMYFAEGSGLSAVQIGILQRVVILDNGTGLIKLINPVLIEEFGEQRAKEGCLSIPEIYGIVVRPQKVVVKALDALGETITMEAMGPMASAICHEIDHLEGILFIDKVIPGTLVNTCNS